MCPKSYTPKDCSITCVNCHRVKSNFTNTKIDFIVYRMLLMHIGQIRVLIQSYTHYACVGVWELSRHVIGGSVMCDANVYGSLDRGMVILHCESKKHQQYYSFITLASVGQFSRFFTFGFSKEIAIKLLSCLSPHLNYIARWKARGRIPICNRKLFSLSLVVVTL